MSKKLVTIAGMVCALTSAAAFADERGAVIPDVSVDASIFEETPRTLRKPGITVAPEQLRAIVAGTNKDSLYALIGPPHFGEGITRRWNYVIMLTDGTADRLRCRLQIDFARPEGGGPLFADRVTWSSQQCADRIYASRS